MAKHEQKDFLKDRDFIIWRLTGDPYLESFWEEYLETRPEQKESFDKAIRDFAKTKLNDERMPAEEEDRLLGRIHASAAGAEKRRRPLPWRLAVYAAAACALFAAGLSVYHSFRAEEEEKFVLSENKIVWDTMEEKDISLITGEETATFSNDIRVRLDKDGSAKVEEIGSETEKVIDVRKTKMNTLVVPYGKRSQLTLADGSEVWINSGSVLEFPSSFTGKSREITLMGEMYLDIARNEKQPFIIHTKDMRVKVYGTKFNVSAYRDDAAPSVVLVEGSVGVKNLSEDRETRMAPHEMLVFRGGRFEKTKVDVSRFISWKDGYLILGRTPITDVFKQVERYYNITFSYPSSNNLHELTCTGKIYLSDDVNNVMETISLLSGTKYKRENKTIYIETIKEQMPMK